MMLCGALRSDGSGYRESRTKTEFASVITPRWSVVEKNISVGATSWLAPVGSGRTSSALASSLTVDAPNSCATLHIGASATLPGSSQPRTLIPYSRFRYSSAFESAHLDRNTLSPHIRVVSASGPVLRRPRVGARSTTSGDDTPETIGVSRHEMASRCDLRRIPRSGFAAFVRWTHDLRP